MLRFDGLRLWYTMAVGLSFCGMASISFSSEPTEANSAKWPWTRLTAPDVPQVDGVEHPIDAFVRSLMAKQGLEPAPPADAAARLRRIYFGLVGLPPTPQEMSTFLEDPSELAYRERIDQLLADRSYGERWGRHWLDLVRYADTQGGALDYARPHMWRYRDYVVRAFNQDRPYDRFIREQLAGDAFTKYGAEGKIGLAFLHQWVPVERTEPEMPRRDFLNDVVGVTGSVFLGVTLGCARCHDHKYDPIPTEDYYRFEAFFGSLKVSAQPLPFGQYEKPNDEPDAWEKNQAAWAEALEKRKKWQDETMEAFKQRLRDRHALVATADLKDFVADDGSSRLAAAMDEGLLFSPEEQETYELIKRQTARFANPNHRDYFQPSAYLASDSPLKHNIVTHVLSGGSPKLKGDAVSPGYLTAATDQAEDVDLTGQSGPARKLLAEWIASADHPLTARVMVNRIWQYHFGDGLVETPSDFGINGSGTVHTDLLDWLASQFISNGFSIKDMHRLILTSQTYQQSMVHPRAAEFDVLDADNKYLWVRSPLRIEAEVIRDGVLAVSGALNREMGGPPFFPVVDDELMRRAPTWWTPSSVDQRNRRTVYMLQMRSLQLPFVKAFNGPNIDESCPIREVTTVTPQVFALFNSDFMHRQSRVFAERIIREAGPDPALQIDHAYALAFQRQPSTEELERCLGFLHGHEDGARPESTERLADLCLVLLNSNEFVFLN